MTTGYKIEYKKDKKSKCKYVCADLKSVNDTGFTWIHQESAKDAKEVIAKKMQVPIGRLKIRNVEMEEIDVKHVDPNSITFSSMKKDDVSDKKNDDLSKVQANVKKKEKTEEKEKNEEKKKAIKKSAEKNEGTDDCWLNEKYDAVLNSIIDLGTAITSIESMIDQCNQIIQIEDLREQDFMHYIECRNLSASDSSHLFKVFKKSRIKRRNAKDLKNTLMAIRNCQTQIKDAATIASMAKSNANEYHPRVEKDLFK